MKIIRKKTAVLCIAVLLCALCTSCGAVQFAKSVEEQVLGTGAVTPTPMAQPTQAPTPTPVPTQAPDTNHWQALEAVRGHWFYHVETGNANMIVTQYVMISGSDTAYTVSLAHYASEGGANGKVHAVTQQPDGSYFLRFGNNHKAYFTTDDTGALLFTFDGADRPYNSFYYAGANDEEARESWSSYYF